VPCSVRNATLTRTVGKRAYSSMLRLIGARAGPATIIDAGADGSAACNGAMPTVVSTVAKASKMERADMAAISRPSRPRL
jgi:hypothetical protein